MVTGKKKKIKFTKFQTILLGFAGVVLVGALLLMLPFSSKEGVITPFNEALFTATSAVCVTGLVVQDTATYWSVFGQAIILILIQIGGLGVVTMAASVALLSGKKISLMQRSTMQEAIAAPGTGGIVKLTNFILRGTFFIEFVGAILMMPVFFRDFGLKGIWMAFFHSISAFCNAGFDLMGTPDSPFQSLVSYSSNAYINVILMLLIVVGGVGFLTWNDFHNHKFRIKKYRMQSKVILVTSGVLILFPAIIFFINDYASLPLGERILASLFQSVTTRTAGFNTQDLTEITGAGTTIMICLMLIGGSPGSTAGGMKTTTVAVLFANLVSVFKRKEDTNMFGRRIEPTVVKNAAAILLMYVSLFFGGAVIISLAENLPMSTCIFETASAVGTVGLTLGITPSLGLASQLVLIVLMFLGRVGGLTVIYAAFSGYNKNISKYPVEKITVG